MKIISIFVIALAAGVAALAEPCREVTGAQILGSDVAAAVPELAGLEPEVPIALSPLAGVVRVMHTAEIARIARKHSLPPPGRAMEICFVRKTRQLSPEQIRPVLEKILTNQSGASPQIEILDYSRYPVPDGSLEFPRGALGPSGVWHGRVVTDEGRSTPVWVRIRVIDASTGSAMPLSPSAEPREVGRGESVRVEVSIGLTSITYDSVAESSGRKGETVLVSSPDKKRRLVARVEDRGKVSIRK